MARYRNCRPSPNRLRHASDSSNLKDAFNMLRALNNPKDALKYFAQMLSKLRISSLSPRKYYQLCFYDTFNVGKLQLHA
ncbi:hypothetical protein RJ641_011344 [Dillenia turbinata]|uniref:Uncharacterized protein n=1 Tax=Dillenia turbinata TaxID=194707 RepID=A0AAN8Z580_9MAGN